MKHFINIIFLIFFMSHLSGQTAFMDAVYRDLRNARGNVGQEKIVQVKMGKKVFSALVQDGDTIIIASLKNVAITSPKSFANQEDYLKYMKYRRYASSVFPYAKEAIRIFREAESETFELKKRKRKKYLRRLSKELETEFENPLKKLSKTQGKIMIKMIERELGESMFDLIKKTNGRFKAAYWNQSSKLYGYRLKEGYVYGHRPILDIVLMDFDISYEVPNN